MSIVSMWYVMANIPMSIVIQHTSNTAALFKQNYKYSLEHRAAHALGHLHICCISRASYALGDS